MYYIFQNGDDFGFKCDDIHEITESDVLISDDIYWQFFNFQCGSDEYCCKSLKLKDIHGTTFDEIFEEYVPEVEDPEDLEPSEIDILKKRIEDLESIVAALTPSVEDVVIRDGGAIIEND